MWQNWLLQQGIVPFSKFMDHVLYHDNYGYYTDGKNRVGKAGDFITSVSAGSLYGELLAQQIINFWQISGKKLSFSIVEMGANNGDLCGDIMLSLYRQQPAIMWTYRIVEPLNKLQSLQQKNLQKLPQDIYQTIQWYHCIGDVPNQECGCFIANELMDALPFEIMRYQQNCNNWQQAYVGYNEEQQCAAWHWQAITNRDFLNQILPTVDYSHNYQTEYRSSTMWQNWLQDIYNCHKVGFAILADYGYEQQDYYADHRRQGTIRTYQQHRAGTNPLANPTQCDITAHVPFTQVLQQAKAIGWHVTNFSKQGLFFTKNHSTYLEELATKLHIKKPQLWRKKLQQWQTLTHPYFLGENFHIITLSKQLS